MFSGILSKILPSLSPFAQAPLFDTLGYTFSQSFSAENAKKAPTPGEPWLNKSSAAPVTGEASMSISLACPPSPRWGKRLIWGRLLEM